jgi:site-specific recombinase
MDDRGSVAPVIARIEQLVLALERHPGSAARLRERLEKGLQRPRHLTLYTGIGLFSRRGFLREFTRTAVRAAESRADPAEDLKDVLAYVFHRPSDANWVAPCPTTPGGGCWRHSAACPASIPRC